MGDGWIKEPEPAEEVKVPPKPKKMELETEVEIKFIKGAQGQDTLVKGPGKEYRYAPSELDIHTVYPTKIKLSLWNSFRRK